MNKETIHRFARTDNISDLKRMIADGANVDEVDEFNTTALHYAIAEGNLAVAQFLLKCGANVAIQDKQGKTALHYAVEYSAADLVEAIVEACPDVKDVADSHGNEPLWTACFNARGNYDLVRTLLRYGANPSHKNRAGLTPVDIPKRIGDDELAQILVSSSE